MKMLILACLSLLPFLAMGVQPVYLLHQNYYGHPPISHHSPGAIPSGRILSLAQLDKFSPRFINFFKPSFSATKPVPEKKQTPKKSNEETCTFYRGTLVGRECLQFVEVPKTYDDARADCQERDGDLYVPIKYEGLFFQKFFLYFPNAFNVGDGHSLGWIGARKDSPGQPVRTVDGTDVTMDAIFNLRPLTIPQCIHILVDDHVLAGDDCHALKPYTCEFKLSDQDESKKPVEDDQKLDENSYTYPYKFPYLFQPNLIHFNNIV